MSFRSLASKSTQPHVSVIVRLLTRILVPLALSLTAYLYLYPVFLGCVFPSIDGSITDAFLDTLVQHHDSARINPLDTRPNLAPFRLLVLADPQLEGDSSLPDPQDALGNKTVKHWTRLRSTDLTNVTGVICDIREVAEEYFGHDIPRALQAVRKRVDLFGNDYYLAHIFRTLHWWTKPTHVTVLGDLIGSQWVDNEEFEWRGWRYWNRVFAGTKRVEDQFMELGSQGGGLSVQLDDPGWRTRIINLVGNHDIGYAGEITKGRIERFETKYGRVNWDLRFRYPESRMSNNSERETPTLHLVVLNSMLLDTPAMDEELQSNTYTYLNDMVQHRMRPVEDHNDFTLVLTHVPLYKKEGICVDGPLFEFRDSDEDCNGECKPGGLKEQNHLSDYASQPGMLQSIFGMGGDLDAPAQGRGRPGLVLTGHDHEGCDTWHYIPTNSTFKKSEPAADGDQKKTVWEATRWKDADASGVHTGIREVTLRSMMGEFGGNAGLLSAWYDFDRGEWQYDIQMCKLGVQHIWWAIHIIDLLAIVSALLHVFLNIWQVSSPQVGRKIPGDKSMKIE